MNSTTHQHLAEKILEFGLTQAEAAKRIGVTQPTFSRIHAGVHKDPKSSTIKKMESLIKTLSKKLKASNE